MIEIEKLRIDLPNFTLQDVSLYVGKNDFFIFLGPTGAGKTMLLEAIAGMLPVTSGSIKINGKDITRLPPGQRGIGIMYQDYALFPHLTVRENINFGLRYQKSKNKKSGQWVEWLMEQLGIHHLAQRSINNLSGGEKQRTALARALAVRPALLLLDEPLSALDPSFREEIRNILKKLHKESEITFMMVTHDFSEALSLGTKTAILNNGTIEQVGTVSEIFRKPATPFAAEFVGMKNIFPSAFKDSTAIVDKIEVKLASPTNAGKHYIAIRPEDIMIKNKKFSENGMNIFQGKVVNIVDHGPYCEVSTMIGKTALSAFLSKGDLLSINLSEKKDVYIAIRPSSIHTF